MKLLSTSKEEFVKHITESKGDKFARTFVSKATMQNQWDHCVGCWNEDKELMGAIIVTRSKREPFVFNLQLLHTFYKHRRKGVARALTQHSLESVQNYVGSYFRVSSEPTAVPFYEAMGFKFLGKQKSGTQLSMFRIVNNQFGDGAYNLDDPVIHAAVHRRGKGGCVEVF